MTPAQRSSQMFYHSEKLQSTKTVMYIESFRYRFYHSEKLQSTKTLDKFRCSFSLFYHSEKLQSTKTNKIESDCQ